MLTSLYIHIPFCNQICTYCDFHKEMATDKKKRDYINALIKELTYHQDKYKSLETIYIGGGTPSSLDLSLLEKLLEHISSLVDVKNLKEYAIETNPNDISEPFSKLIYKYHLNRVSIGVQTFNQKHLRFLGRTHSNKDVYQAISRLRQVGFKNISIDLIFSLINQTMDELKEDLKQVVSLDIDHISYYSLILEEKTKLFYLYDNDKINLNSEDLEGQMYLEVMRTLPSLGFTQYEISNYAKNGLESGHNKAYWQNKEYLGLGSGAHSLYDNRRFYNIRNVRQYITNMNQGLFDSEHSYPYDELNETLMLGLRLRQGINIDHINKKYNIDLLTTYSKLNDYLDLDILEIKNGYIRFTDKGILLGNEVFKLFMEVA